MESVDRNGNGNLQDTLISIENITFKGYNDVELMGNDSDNEIRSYEGDDLIYAGDGNDEIRAQKGDDTIFAQDGDDYIRSGQGADVISTGSGNDIVNTQSYHATHSLEITDIITDFEIGNDKIELEGILYSDISINQGMDEYSSDTIISISEGYLAILENVNFAELSENDFIYLETNDNTSSDNISSKATFTASIDKWMPDSHTSDEAPKWLDGPIMKLHRKDIEDEVGIDLSLKDGHPGHKHKENMDKGSYELRVEHTQETEGAIDIDDVMGVLALSRGIKETSGKEHELAADWNGDGLIDIDDVMGVLARSRGIRKDDEWRFHDKDSDTIMG